MKNYQKYLKMKNYRNKILSLYLKVKIKDVDYCYKKKIPLSIISTMPRSGTWMLSMFFQAFNELLYSRELENDHIREFNYYKKLNIAKYHAHTIFPGFLDIYNGKFRKNWDKLDFFVIGYNYGYEYLKEKEKDFFPNLNENLKIVYVYRNPLDQAVSYHRHSQKHKDDRHNYVVINNKKRYFTDVNDFVELVGIESYIKQYLSYHLVKEKFKSQLIMIPYERLVLDRTAYLMKISSFIGIDMSKRYMKENLERAVLLTESDNLKKIEKKVGRALGGDLTDSNESHIRGGEVGKWEKHLSAKTVSLVEKRLKEFDLSLNDFILK